jgi:hypothetical protein
MATNIAVSVSQASGTSFKPNKHGVLPIILSPLNGVLPENSGVIDGSIASRLGLQVGGQYVLSISFREYYEANGKKYPNYSYALVTRLGAGFEQMVAQQVVASMNFGFTPASTPTPHEEVLTPTPVQGVDASKVI